MLGFWNNSDALNKHNLTPLTGDRKRIAQLELTNALLDISSQVYWDQQNLTPNRQRVENKVNFLVKKIDEESLDDDFSKSESVESSNWSNSDEDENKGCSDMQRCYAKIWRQKKQSENKYKY